MGGPSLVTKPSEKLPEERLGSWKEIAAYLDRDVTTVQRWEKREGMPVHRHLHDKRGSVYAITSELDAWQRTRKFAVEQSEEHAQTASPSAAESDNFRETGPRSKRWIALGGIAAALGLLIAVYITAKGRNPQGAVRPRVQSLAVLPFKNLSGDPAQDYLADGMTEALIGRLAGIRNLRVISHTSVMRYKNPQISVPEIARALNVDAIVEGSVIRQGNRIRVTAQLIRGPTDEHFWSETYDRELQDVLALQSELAQSITDKVEVTVTGEERQRLSATRTVAPEVYESYLKGLAALQGINGKASIEKGNRYFEDAINRDPTFAPAYVGLAEKYSALGSVLGGAPPSETRPKVINAGQKALDLDPNLVEAHVLLADVLQLEWHWAEAESEYKRALELAPNSAAAHAGFAFWLLSEGRTDEAVTWIKRARDLDPVEVSGVEVGWILFQSRRYDEALRECHSVLAVQPESVPALWYLGFVLNAKGQPKDAIPYLEKAVLLSNRNPAVIAILIRAYYHAGRRHDALKLLAEMKKRSASGYVPAGAFVNAYLGLDDREEAFAALEKAYKEQSNILQFVKVHPFFDPLRSDPRFASLVHRVGLE